MSGLFKNHWVQAGSVVAIIASLHGYNALNDVNVLDGVNDSYATEDMTKCFNGDARSCETFKNDSAQYAMDTAMKVVRDNGVLVNNAAFENGGYSPEVGDAAGMLAALVINEGPAAPKR